MRSSRRSARSTTASGRSRDEVVAGMAEMGLFGLTFPEEHGGMGGDYSTHCLALEQLARVDQSVAITLEDAVSLGAMPVFRFGTEAQKREWLPLLTSGQALGAFGLTEPEAGNDAGGTRTTPCWRTVRGASTGARPSSRTRGRASRVWSLSPSSQVRRPVAARRSARSSPRSPCAGFSAGPAYDKVGWHASDTHPLTFDDVRVPEENLLGERGRGYAGFLQILDEGRIAIAALASGAGKVASTRACGTRGSGPPSADPSGRTRPSPSASYAWRRKRMRPGRRADAASKILAGLPFKKEAAIAKLVAGEAAMDSARDATQVHGGYGFMNEYVVARTTATARCWRWGRARPRCS